MKLDEVNQELNTVLINIWNIIKVSSVNLSLISTLLDFILLNYQLTLKKDSLLN